MAKANKTVETEVSVEDFLARVEPPQRVADARVLIDLMAHISGEPPKLWGPSIIGFGSIHYRYESGREGDTPAIAFSPRKAESVLYVGASTPNIAALLPGLGKHKTGKGCLYVKKLADVDAEVLEAVVQTAWENRLAGHGA
ncbi:MAG: DUF1801 domain-containing protein [Sphingomonas sp.]|uniref:DUF1801 domain-containing protein n=1 Tax=Sphingomonas sp. TaxID=28214 RepID=UPI0025D7A11C|nr:DUF1801 domain-containing protein [Sphingomonas sp.]MBY0283420.1 DUF1801 domain-containing protein [Sphingomonas sp.]